MRTSLNCLAIAFVLRLAFDTVTAQQPAQTAFYNYEANPALPREIVELSPNQTVHDYDFYVAPPNKRPVNIPPSFVLVKVISDSEFIGYLYMDANEVNRLHGIGQRL